MCRLTWHPRLASVFLISILTILINAYPSFPRETVVPDPSPRARNINHQHHLLPRTGDSDPFLGPEWDIPLMENRAAYLPHSSAAPALEAFYTSLATVAQYPIYQPLSYFVHRIGRVSIIFRTSPEGILIPMDLILRFATRMLEFTRRGYTLAYRMMFRHQEYGFLVEVVLSVDEPSPPQLGEGECVPVVEEHGEVNGSGVRQTCVLRGPGFPPR